MGSRSESRSRSPSRDRRRNESQHPPPLHYDDYHRRRTRSRSRSRERKGRERSRSVERTRSRRDDEYIRRSSPRRPSSDRHPDRSRLSPPRFRDDRDNRPSFNNDREGRGNRDGGRGGGGGGGGRSSRGRGGRRQEEDFDESRQRWGKAEDYESEEEEPLKEPEPDFGLSGALAAETNTVNGVVMLHNEPAEARIPTQRWRLYVFKDGQPFGDPLHIHRESCYLFGRERKIVAVPTDHPSCSKQHAVIQYRLTEKEGADGMMHTGVRPYVMDLGSTNGTFLNGERIEAQRYYELLEQDVLKFGNSTREYVLLKEK